VNLGLGRIGARSRGGADFKGRCRNPWCREYAVWSAASGSSALSGAYSASVMCETRSRSSRAIQWTLRPDS